MARQIAACRCETTTSVEVLLNWREVVDAVSSVQLRSDLSRFTPLVTSKKTACRPSATSAVPYDRSWKVNVREDVETE